MLNNRGILITLSVILIASLIAGGIFLIMRQRENMPEDDAPIDREPTTEGKSPIVLFSGDAALSREREALLDPTIIAEIDCMRVGTPMADEEGNYLTDENGVLLNEGGNPQLCDALMHNLAVIVNHFCDRGYSVESITQIQRFYYHYAQNLTVFTANELLNNMELCFPTTGATVESLNAKAEEVFGMHRSDGYRLVFENDTPPMMLRVTFCEVKPHKEYVLTEDEQSLCIYDEWTDDTVEDRNLHAWLHAVIHQLSIHGYGEKEIVVAQLLYAGSLAECEYRHDWLDALRQCISREREMSADELRRAVQLTFDVDIANNVALMDYLEGATAYRTGG